MQHKVRLLEPDRICECASFDMTILTINGMCFLSVHTSRSKTKVFRHQDRLSGGAHDRWRLHYELECRELGFVDSEIYQSEWPFQ